MAGEVKVSSQLAIVMFTDIVGSVGLKRKLGLTVYSRLLSRHDELVRALILAEEGAEIRQDTGDGFYAFFGSPSSAVRSALLIQQAMRAEDWGRAPLKVRVGIHMGETTRIAQEGSEKGKELGLAIDMAARVMGLAEGGQILLTRAPFDEARKFVDEHPLPVGVFRPIPLRWMAHGPYLFKGADEPMEIFEVGAEGLAPLAVPGDAEKAKRVATHDQEETLGWRPAAGQPVPNRAGWLLESKLGEGGFGEVWLARQERLGESRAFKFCFDAVRLRSLKRELALFRLMREALGERKDIAKLYDVKLDEPPYFLESEYTSGGSLVEWGERAGGIGMVPLAQRLEIVAVVAEAVDAAHSVGVLHKDLKPSNILIDTAGGKAQPKLADFGIGALAEASGWEKPGMMFTGITMMSDATNTYQTGTPLYRPPESLAGQAFTTQGDVYALGVILYQMAIGNLRKPLAPGWERDVKDPLMREDIREAVEGDPTHRLSDAKTLAERIRHLDERRSRAEAKHRQAELQRRRKQTMRMAVGFSVVLALLLLVSALVGGYYIRGIRKAEAEAVAARKQAEASMEEAKEQAVNARRVAAHAGAQYFLGQGRLRDAFREAAKAMELKPDWQDGYTLFKIVAEAREYWHPVRAYPIGSAPRKAAFVSSASGPELLTADGTELVLYALGEAEPVRRVPLAGAPMLIADLPGERALLAYEKELIVVELPSLKIVQRVAVENKIYDVATRGEAGEFAVLTEGAVQMRKADTLEVAAETPFAAEKPVAGFVAVPQVDLSVEGDAVLVVNATWSEKPVALWKWKTGGGMERVPGVMQKARFTEDGRVIGLTSSQGADVANVSVVTYTEKGSQTQTSVYPTPFATTRVEVIFRGGKDGRGELGLYASDGLHVIDVATGRETQRLRYDSLLPAQQGEVTLAALSSEMDRLALVADGKMTVFERGAEPLATMGTQCWSFAATATDFYTTPGFVKAMGDGDELLLVERRAAQPNGAKEYYKLIWPKQEGPGRPVPWGMAITPDGRRLAVLWQESFGNEHLGSTYGRKAILVYELPERGGGKYIEIKQTIPLLGYDGVDGRNNRNVSITPDASRVLYRTSSGEVVLYETSSGREVKRWQAGEVGACSDDGRWLATGDNSKTSPVTVWDAKTGETVFQTAEVEKVPRLCFSSDAKRLLVGTGETLRVYDWEKKVLLSSLKTPLLPMAAPEGGDVFLAQKLNFPISGAILAARLSDGQPLEILQDSGHVLTKAAFAGNGKGVGFAGIRREVRLGASLTLEEARELLKAR